MIVFLEYFFSKPSARYASVSLTEMLRPSVGWHRFFISCIVIVDPPCRPLLLPLMSLIAAPAIRL